MSTTATALRNKILGGGAAPDFDALVEQAVDALRELSRPSTFAYQDCRPEKLNAEQYLKAAMDFARTDVAALKGLREALAGIDPTDWGWLARFRAGAHKAVRATRLDEGAALCPPTSNWASLMNASPEDQSSLLIECLSLGCTPASVLALEVWLATQEEPECFGLISRPWAEHHAHLERQQAKLRELYQRIGESWTTEDVSFVLVDEREGLGRLVWKRAPHVNVYPQGAEGLVQHLALEA